MVKRYSIAGTSSTPPGWHDYVLASDYDALANTLQKVWTNCVFSGPPPQGFMGWSEWAAGSTYQNVTVTATPADCVQQHFGMTADPGNFSVEGK